MPTHNVSIRDKFANQVTTDIDAGTGAGNFVLYAAGSVEVATCPFNEPSFGAASAGAITMDNTPIPTDSDATGGTVTDYAWEDGDATAIVSGPESELTLSVNPIPAASIVEITNATYTATP